MEEALKLLGFGTPFVYAGATYGLFHWLDQNASRPAQRAISAWIRSSEYRKEHIAAAVVGMFDSVYGYPLLTWRAFFRSVLVSLVVLTLFTYEFLRLTTNEFNWRYIFDPNAIHLFVVVTNLVSDYISLFVIRKALVYASQRPVLALVFGAACGLLITAFLVTVRDVGILLFVMHVEPSVILDRPIGAFSAYSMLMDYLNFFISRFLPWQFTCGL